MIDTLQNYLDRASTSRSAAEGSLLDNVRRKHLASAAAWEGLARMLGKKGGRHNLRLSKLHQTLAVSGEG